MPTETSPSESRTRPHESRPRTALPGKVLLVSWSVAPQLVGSASIVENLSRQFGRDELVMVGERPAASQSYKRDPSLPPIHYVDREWTWPPRGKAYFERLRWFLLPRLYRRVAKVFERENCQAVVGVFPNELYLLVAYQVAKRYGVPLYPYLHNTYSDNRHGTALRLAHWLERRVFEMAPVVFVMSEGMQRHYEPLFPGVRFEPLVHTFNEDLPKFVPPPAPARPLRVAMLGNLNGSNVDASQRFVSMIRGRDDVVLTTYSGTPTWFFQKVGVTGPNVTHSSAAYEEVAGALAKHDVIFIPHGLTGGLSQIEYDTIFPTRTIPCLVSGRPILAHSPTDCFFTRWLRKHKCAEIVDTPDQQALAAALDRLRNDDVRRAELVSHAMTAARQFHAPVVVEHFKQILSETWPSRAAAPK